MTLTHKFGLSVALAAGLGASVALAEGDAPAVPDHGMGDMTGMMGMMRMMQAMGPMMEACTEMMQAVTTQPAPEAPAPQGG